MVDNIAILLSGICVFLAIKELQIVQLLSVPEPCPDYAQNATIADMCTTDFASEESKNGGTTVDSVALRVMTQQDGCECEVSLKNQYNKNTIYTRKYDFLRSAVPESQACGLSIDVDYTSSENFPEDKTPIKCTKGTDTRSVSLLPYGVLHLRSKIIGGNFSRGYCLQIYRHHITGDNVRIQINCSIPSMKTTTQQDKTVSDTDTDATLYIAIGVGSAVVVIALFVVAIVIIRRKGNENKYENQIQPDNECTDDDSDGLKYNSLYNSSEQHDIMEGDYHTVELEGTKNRTGIQKLGSDNSAVDGNYSSIAIVNIHAKDGSKTDSRMKSSSTTTPRLETQRTEEETRKKLKHVTAGSNVEYAVVDKSGRTVQNLKHVTAPNDSNVEYAVIDKE